MLASPADGAWAGYCGLRTGQTKWNELQGTGHKLVPNTLLERPVLPKKHSFLVLPLHKTRTFDYFFLLSLFSKGYAFILAIKRFYGKVG